jgi:uncharacterized protein YdaU (DUF1376 family)
MAIHKPEWFKMDPAKFLSDAQVEIMSTLELGACLRLMCRQWIDGYIPDNLSVLARLCRLDADAMREAWVTLEPFFPTIGLGKRANKFMWLEREKVGAALLRKSDEGTRAARKRWDETRNVIDAAPNGSPMPDPMQDQTRPEQTRPDKNISSEQKSSSDALLLSKKVKQECAREAVKLAALLKAEILSNKPDYRITQHQERQWSLIADRMLRIDKRKFEEAWELIRWVQKDEFWSRNVLSMDTLRKKFDQLSLNAKPKVKAQPSSVALPADYVSASEQIKREQRQASAVTQ